MMLLWGVVLLCVGVHSQNVAFDCTSDRSNYTTISLLEVGECSFDDQDFKEEQTEIQLLKLRETKEVNIFSCLITLNYVIQHCGHNSHNSLVKGGIVSELYELTREECLTMHKLRRARVYGQEFQIKAFNVTYSSPITLAGGIDPDGTCSSGSFNNGRGYYRNVFAHGEIKFLFSTGTALRMIKEDKLRLSSGVTCRMDETRCVDPVQGRVFWEMKEIFPCDENAYHVLYSGPASKVITLIGHGLSGTPITRTMFTVRDDKQLFTLTTIGEKSVCRFTMFQTEHPSYMITEISRNKYYFRKGRIPTGELDPFIYINSKIMYVTTGIETAMRRMHKTLTMKICELERNHLKTLQTMAHISPVSFAYQYMGGPGYTAISAGEVIHVIRCHPVPVLPRKGEDCTIEYPVIYRNESFFVTPRSHILQKGGTPSPCGDILAPEYRFGKNWYVLNRKMTPIRDPITLSPKKPATWDGLDLGNLMTGGFYTLEQIEEIRNQIMYPQERKSTSERIASGINKDAIISDPIDYTTFISEDVLRSRFHEFWLETWGWFRFIGDFGSTFFTIYVLYIIVVKTFAAVARVKMIHELFGCSAVIIVSLIDGVCDYVLHKNSHKFKQNETAKKREEEINGTKAEKEHLTREVMLYPNLTGQHFVDIPNAPPEPIK